MFAPTYTSFDLNDKKILYDTSFDHIARFSSDLYSPMIPPNDYIVNMPGVSDMNAKETDLDLDYQMSEGNTIITKRDAISYLTGELDMTQSLAKFYSLAPFSPIEGDLINYSVCDNAFVSDGSDLDPTAMITTQMGHPNVFKESLPSFTELPSTVISGYNLELPVGFEEQQPYFNSGATTSSLMCCTTQNIVVPEGSISHLPDLAAPDEFISSDEDNNSAADDHDYPDQKDEVIQVTKETPKEVETEKEQTECSDRHLEHSDSQTVIKPVRRKLTSQARTKKHCKLGHIRKRNSKLSKKSSVFYQDQSDNSKRTRKNYDKTVINILMSWYLEHDGKIPDSSAKDDLCKQTGKSIVQISTWFQNARRRYAGKLEAYRLYSIKHPDIVYDSESLDAFLRSKQM
ncbi:hypothetical protein G6F70_001068 [Rhizopus microsporus]|uniref:Homeobox domain-containing protein n=2 Tax=Rhizopus TaxID=4842 RepID=A0A367JXN3_RHIAZ|nr:hypothetical protein G6F71_007076 [Rhizopus microsporus]RCH94690.1 hypothetical protein CU097_011863 [Rhizopus azygosporus]KAG1203765.1 hypothetical protein G6F70_001068 [Rhizopus microsporus]KAG1215494.1 hypothetical protein G6F69_000934 [Rhizopus microsporus]KAG1234909.1 hypothetical protein G6F67_003177 [Rhizopus microsporus]